MISAGIWLLTQALLLRRRHVATRLFTYIYTNSGKASLLMSAWPDGSRESCMLMRVYHDVILRLTTAHWPGHA